MISCKRAAELISRSLDGRLPGWRRLVLGFHLGLCGKCRRFRRQSELLQRAGRLLRQRGPTGAALSEAARARIKQAIRQQGHGGPA
jgi:hypothetical protein